MRFTITLFALAIFGSSANASDPIVTTDVNGDQKADVVRILKTSEGWELRVWDVTARRKLSTTTLAANRLNGWMDAADRTLVADVNGDGRKDLVLINTDGKGGAVQAIDITSGERLALIDYAGTRFNGWFDSDDIAQIGDVDNDGCEDLILVNTAGTDGAVQAINFTSGRRVGLIDYER